MLIKVPSSTQYHFLSTLLTWAFTFHAIVSDVPPASANDDAFHPGPVHGTDRVVLRPADDAFGTEDVATISRLSQLLLSQSGHANRASICLLLCIMIFSRAEFLGSRCRSGVTLGLSLFLHDVQRRVVVLGAVRVSCRGH